MGVLAAPFVVMAICAVIAASIGAGLASLLYGGWIDLSGVGYWLAGAGFAAFWSVFFWIDALTTRALPNGWRSMAAMWRGLLVTTVLAVIAALMLGVVLVVFAGALSSTGLDDKTGQGVLIALAGCLLVCGGVGAVYSFRVRSNTVLERPETHHD